MGTNRPRAKIYNPSLLHRPAIRVGEENMHVDRVRLVGDWQSRHSVFERNLPCLKMASEIQTRKPKVQARHTWRMCSAQENPFNPIECRADSTIDCFVNFDPRASPATRSSEAGTLMVAEAETVLALP